MEGVGRGRIFFYQETSREWHYWWSCTRICQWRI